MNNSYNRISCVNRMLMKNEIGAEPNKYSQKNRLKQYSFPAMTKFVNRCEALSNGN